MECFDTFFFVATNAFDGIEELGGLGVLAFSGSDLSLIAPLDGNASQRIQQRPPFVYAMGVCGYPCGFHLHL